MGGVLAIHAVCPDCRSPFIRVVDDAGQTIHEWPNAGNGPAPAGVPLDVAEDWREAHQDLGIRSWKSAATMARRAVQGVCLQQGATKSKLGEQIKQLAENSTLHPNIVDWAHQVRLFGNNGAHPGDDGLAGVTEESARDAVAFLDELLQWVYVMPGRVTEARARSGQA